MPDKHSEESGKSANAEKQAGTGPATGDGEGEKPEQFYYLMKWGDGAQKKHRFMTLAEIQVKRKGGNHPNLRPGVYVLSLDEVTVRKLTDADKAIIGKDLSAAELESQLSPGPVRQNQFYPKVLMKWDAPDGTATVSDRTVRQFMSIKQAGVLTDNGHVRGVRIGRYVIVNEELEVRYATGEDARAIDKAADTHSDSK